MSGVTAQTTFVWRVAASAKYYRAHAFVVLDRDAEPRRLGARSVCGRRKVDQIPASHKRCDRCVAGLLELQKGLT